jgi:hypothetical protein
MLPSFSSGATTKVATLSNESEGKKNEPSANQGFDYILAVFIFIASLITGTKPSKENSQGNTSNPDYQIAKWTKVVGRWTRWLVVVGAITTAVLALQTCILKNQLTETRLEQRAWIAPERIIAPENFQQGKDEPAAIGLAFQNTGKEPAFDVNVEGGLDIIEGVKWRDNSFMQAKVRELLKNRTCKDIDTLPNGRTVFPGQHPSVLDDLEQEKAFKAAHPENGYLAVVVACFVYRTMDEIHWSEFCGVLAPPNRSNDNKWQTVFCGVHNRAN